MADPAGFDARYGPDHEKTAWSSRSPVAAMLLKHAAMFLVWTACLSAGMTSAFAVEIPQVRNHAPPVVGVNVSVSHSKQATLESNDADCSAASARRRWLLLLLLRLEMPCSAVATHWRGLAL